MEKYYEKIIICIHNYITNLSLSKGSLLHKDGKGVLDMTYPELILKMVEKLLEEKDKNYELQSKLEEYKKSKD